METRDVIDIKISIFDESATNYVKTSNTIAELCREDTRIPSDGGAEYINFFSKWKKIQYSTQNVRVFDGINSSEKFSLPPFSSAAIPHGGKTRSPSSYRDFIFNAGGSVWALDWCPKSHNDPPSAFKCEFVAVTVHPPDSLYHKIGVPLHGLGTVQIWRIISSSDGSFSKEHEKKPYMRPRGRPTKKQIPVKTDAQANYSIDWENCTQSSCSKLASVATWKELEFRSSGLNDISLPQMVMCLAHQGTLVWDLKWKPNNTVYNCYQMGYLAVLLGNGSLQVWEIYSPAAVREIHSSSSKEGTDPRFVRPIPVFKCSNLMCGGVQSIPLTVEWSSSDNLLVGCHDGTVALWKFSPVTNCDDTLPFLCFSADSFPIRSVAWNPLTDEESSNIILTAGHGGIKFWDIRDPFRPLCDLHPVPRFIYSADWVADPNCVMSAYDDGTMRLQSLTKTGFHTLNCSTSAIWSVHVSKITEMVAYCSADGTVRYFELNRKAVEKDPSRHKMAQHVCSRMGDEEEDCVTVYVSSGNIVDGTVAEVKTEMKMPSKKIAMQRVRWNMNRGSEHWLSSAGASGIVRCQEIPPF